MGLWPQERLPSKAQASLSLLRDHPAAAILGSAILLVMGI